MIPVQTWTKQFRTLTDDIPQCGNWDLIQLLWFCVKSILADFRGSKTAILTIFLALNFDIWENFIIENVKNSQKIKIQCCWNGQNGNFWPFEISQNWFHVKSEWQKNLKIFTLLCVKVYFDLGICRFFYCGEWFQFLLRTILLAQLFWFFWFSQLDSWVIFSSKM